MKISVVTTLYNSAAYIDEFYRRIKDSLKKITDDYQIIFVNDGSPDDSLRKALKLSDADRNIEIIDLSRNFGHHKAMMTGLSHADGDYVFLIDSDLEEEPELVEAFWEELSSNNELDVVYGVQASRKGRLFEKISGFVFYKIFNFFSSIKLTPNIITCRLMTRRYVKALIGYKERELFIAGVWAAAGYSQKALVVNKKQHSPTNYNLFKKIDILINGLVSFSNGPLVCIFYFGLAIMTTSMFYVAWLMIKRYLLQITVAGWTTIVVSIWLIGGIIIFCLGIMGLYLSKIFTETKGRPYTVIKRAYRQAGEGKHDEELIERYK